MAISDKELMRRFQRRVNRLETVGATDSDAYGRLQNQLDVFWENTNKSPKTKTRATLSKQLNTQERKEMRKIMRKFLEEPLTDIPTITERYEQLTEQHKQYLSPKMQNQQVKKKSISEKTSYIKRVDRLLKDYALTNSLSSPIVKTIWENQKATGESANKYRQAMDSLGSYAIEDDGKVTFVLNDSIKRLTQQEIIDEIISKVGEL